MLRIGPDDLVALAVLAIVSVAACAHHESPRIPPSPVAGQTVQTWQAPIPGTDARAVYVRNDGQRPIVITEVRITQCINLRQACATYETNAVVAPGETVRVMRLERASESRVSAFTYEYTWKTAETAP
jgi:hypothetical protein